MSIRAAILFLVLAVGVVLVAVAEEEKPEKPKLPEDPDAVVLSLDYWSGLEPSAVDEPVLGVRADGRLRAPDPWHGHGTAEGRLTTAEVEALVTFVVVEKRFFEIDEAAIAKQVRESRDAVPVPPDTAVTIVRVTLADREKKVEYLGLDDAAARHPEIRALARLKAIVDRLDRLRVVTTAGGEKAVERWLRLANEALAKRDEKAEPLTAADLDDAFITEKGGRRVRFRRVREGAWVTAVIVAPGGDADPQVVIESGPENR